jgi:PhnB protein
MAKRIPDGYRTITPYVRVRGATEAMAFYAKAFGAEEIYRLSGPGGGIMHAEIQIGNSRLMLGEECPEYGALSPAALGGTAVGLHLYVEDADAAARRAVEAGCELTMPVALMPWGDRYGKLKDPFGHEWSVGTHVEDVAPAEIERRMGEMMCGEGKKG